MQFQTLAAIAAVSLFAVFDSPVHAAGLAITNYQVVSQQSAAGTQSYVTYRADLSNAGSALGSVTATLNSVDPFTVRVVPGEDGLQFSPVPANSQVTSQNTFTILVNTAVPFDSNKLQWTFGFDSKTPIAFPGPNQRVAAGTAVTLNGSDSISPNGGALSYRWSFESRPAGSSAALTNASRVLASFVPDVQGSYIVTLTVSNGLGSSSANVAVSTLSGPPPVANAGANQTVAAGSKVVLNGSASTSSSGPLTYAWTLVSIASGSTATLTGANTVSPSFVADKPGDYVARLVVSDGTSSSAPSSVTISTVASKPVANAGPAQMIIPGSQVHLNGAGSTDVGGRPLTYNWSLLTVPPGSTAALSNPTLVNPVFTADMVGTYVAQLIVNNGTSDSDPVTVMITTIAPPPIASAGPNQIVGQNTVVQLNGSGTDPRNLPLTFLWTLIAKPAGSHAVLSNPALANPTFVADASGDFIAQLIVNNGTLNSTPTTVVISTGCAPPIANAGSNQSVRVGGVVNLNGSGSGPACATALTYSWSFTTRPNGSAATLSASNSGFPSFTADVAGMYVIQLIVNNGASSSPATVSVIASNGAGLTIPDGLTIGENLQVKGVVSIGAPAPAGGLDVLLKANNFNDLGLEHGGRKLLLISPSATQVGSDFITVTIPAGASSVPFYLQAQDGVSGVTYTASAPGFTTVTGNIRFAPSGIVITGPALVHLGESLPLTVSTAQLDPDTYNLVAPQALAAGFSVTVGLQNSNYSVGSIFTPVTITGGSDGAVAQFTSQSVGTTTITVQRTAMFIRAGNNTSVTLTVVP